jgi:hypothetical protein
MSIPLLYILCLELLYVSPRCFTDSHYDRYGNGRLTPTQIRIIGKIARNAEMNIIRTTVRSALPYTLTVALKAFVLEFGQR